MKQISIRIQAEEFFNKIYIVVDENETNKKYSDDIRETLNKNINKINNSTKPRIVTMNILKKYQSSKLPSNIDMTILESGKTGLCDLDYYNYICDFYDPESRIITITIFEED